MSKSIELTDDYMLRMLVKQANSYGALLQVRKHKKYPLIVCGTDVIGRSIKVGGTAKWLYDELLLKMTNYF